MFMGLLNFAKRFEESENFKKEITKVQNGKI